MPGLSFARVRNLTARGALCAVLLAGAARAATLTVTTTADELNADGDCALREALRAANTDTAVDACPAGNGDDTVVLGSGTYALTIAGAGEDDGLTGDLDVRSNVTLEGSSAVATVIDGNGAVVRDRVLHVVDAVAVTVRNLTFRNGDGGAARGGGVYVAQGTVVLENAAVRNSHTNEDGGGIANYGGTLTVTGSTLSGNSAGVQGGGIWNSATLALRASTVSDNTAIFGGGGVSHNAGTDLVIDGSLLTGNAVTFGALGGGGLLVDTSDGSAVVIDTTITANAASNGGGVSNTGGTAALALVGTTVSANVAQTGGGGVFTSGPLELTNTTVSGNQAQSSSGGGLYNFGGTVELSNVTLTANVAADAGGGLRNDGGTTTARNSIVAGNADSGAGAPDCKGALASAGYTLLGDPTNCTFASAIGDRTAQNPNLGALADNGGPTRTHALLAPSPAIDGGDPAGCADSLGVPVVTDQRGLPRPVGGVCDMGAYESDPTGTTTTTTSVPGTTTTTLPPNPACPGGGTSIAGAAVLLGRLNAPAGNETLVFRGRLNFAPGLPASVLPQATGAQVLIEDLGTGATPLLDLTAATTPVPPGGPGSGCDPHDGWRGRVYKNRSKALDPPTCTSGSTRGLKKMKLIDERAAGGGVRVVVKAKRMTLPALVGPLRATVVLGAAAAAADAGECGSHAFGALCLARPGQTVFDCR